ncbi:hypothetical protein B484DRAFT_444389 [Ochromonadaceae sp. CCMP2298]|nr:hypothetical protein B484DRAFT_444389 [Ochromonadaceae sp. CCMP2298]
MSQQQQGQQQSLQQQYLQQQYHQQQQYLMYQQQQQQQHQQQQGMGGSADQGGYGGGGGFGPLLGYSGGYMSAQGGSSGSSGGGDGGAGLPRVDSMDILKTISHIASTDSLVGWDKGGSQLDLINFGSTDVLSNLARDGSEMNLGDWPSFSNLVALADGRQEGVEEDSPSAEAGPVRSGRLGSRQAGQAVEQAEAQRVRAPIMDYSAPIAQSSMAAMAHMYNGGHQPAEGGGGAGTARSGAGPSKGEGSSAGRAAPLARRETSNGSSRSALPLVDVKSEGAGRGGGGLPKNSSVEDFWVGDLPMPDQNLQSSGPGAVDAGAAQRGASSSSTVAGLVKAEEGTVSFAVSNTGAPNGNPPFIPRASDRDHQVGMLDKTKRELSVGDGLDQGMGVTLVTKKPKTEAP